MEQDSKRQQKIRDIGPYITQDERKAQEFQQAVMNRNYGKVKTLLQDPYFDPTPNIHLLKNAVYGSISDAQITKLLLDDKRIDPSSIDLRWLLNSISSIEELISRGVVSREKTTLNETIKSLKLLVDDHRVDWRNYINHPLMREILQEKMRNEKSKLKKELTTSYLSLEKSSPQINLEYKTVSKLPKQILKKVSYDVIYNELCQKIDGDVPPIKLLALADLLRIEYNIQISWKDLCNKVNSSLLLLL